MGHEIAIVRIKHASRGGDWAAIIERHAGFMRARREFADGAIFEYALTGNKERAARERVFVAQRLGVGFNVSEQIVECQGVVDAPVDRCTHKLGIELARIATWIDGDIAQRNLTAVQAKPLTAAAQTRTRRTDVGIELAAVEDLAIGT